MLSRIAGGEVFSGSIIDADSYLHDLSSRLFRTFEIDHAGKSMHLETSDLE